LTQLPEKDTELPKESENAVPSREPATETVDPGRAKTWLALCSEDAVKFIVPSPMNRQFTKVPEKAADAPGSTVKLVFVFIPAKVATLLEPPMVKERSDVPPNVAIFETTTAPPPLTPATWMSLAPVAAVPEIERTHPGCTSMGLVETKDCVLICRLPL